VLRESTRLVAAQAIARRVAAEDTLLLGAEVSLRDRFAVGEARYVDVLRLRAERLRVQTDRSAVLADAVAARAALIGLVSAGHRDEIGPLVDSLAAVTAVDVQRSLPAAPSIDSLLALAGPVQRSHALRERALAAQALTLAEQRVRIAGSLGVQRRLDDDGSTVFGPVLGASMTLPFTANRANRASRRAAEREVAAADLARDAVVVRVRGVLAGAAARYEAARERLAVYDEALIRAARQERESALAAYRTGELTLLELLDFERSLARAEIDRLRAYSDAVEAWANLISAAVGEAGGNLE
jgi:cobalt-zinc-cadmium efflux system outer membrane protein